MEWSALRVSQAEVEIELVATREFVPNNLPNEFGLKRNVSDNVLLPFQFSLDEVWEAAKDDPSVIGVVPVGYLERGGVPDVAGLFQIDGSGQSQVMHAPPLTAIYCLDIRVRDALRNHPNFSGHIISRSRMFRSWPTVILTP